MPARLERLLWLVLDLGWPEVVVRQGQWLVRLCRLVRQYLREADLADGANCLSF